MTRFPYDPPTPEVDALVSATLEGSWQESYDRLLAKARELEMRLGYAEARRERLEQYIKTKEMK